LKKKIKALATTHLRKFHLLQQLKFQNQREEQSPVVQTPHNPQKGLEVESNQKGPVKIKDYISSVIKRSYFKRLLDLKSNKEAMKEPTFTIKLQSGNQWKVLQVSFNAFDFEITLVIERLVNIMHPFSSYIKPSFTL